MPRPLVMHQITAMDLEPMNFVRLVGEIGCDRISMFTNSPDVILPGQTVSFDFPSISLAQKHETHALLTGLGIKLDGIEYFPITANVDLTGYIGGLALGAELGARRAVCHNHDPELGRAVDTIGTLSRLAAAEGLSLDIEFCPMTKGCASLPEAVALVDAVSEANFRVSIDCLHLIRSGGTSADVAVLDARYIGNVQICDGHGTQTAEVYMHETHEREIPGKGDFPLHEILSAVPATLPIEIEVPANRRREAGVSARNHLLDCIAHARAVTEALSPTR